MKRVLSLIIFLVIFSINLFANVSNPTFDSSDGKVNLIHLTSTITYKFNLLEDNNNLSVKVSENDSSVLILNSISGEMVGSTNFAEPFDELNVQNLASGEYSLLFTGNGDFSIFTNGIDIKDKLSVEVSFDNYEFKLDKTYSDITILEANENAYMTLYSTTSENLFYQNTAEPFNILKITSLEKGIYQLSITITPNINDNTNVSSGEVVDEPTIISADESFKVSNPTVKSNEGEIELIYTGYNKDYKLTLNSTEKDIFFKKTTNDCGLVIWSMSDNSIVIDGCESGIEGELKIDDLPAGEYMINVFNGDLEIVKSPLSGDLMKNVQLINQSDHYEFISKNDLTNIYIENSFKDSNINLFSIENNTLNYQSEESSLKIDRLTSGRYQINVNTNYNIEPTFDESQKISNITIKSNEGEVEYKYSGFTKEYLLVVENELNTISITQNSTNCSMQIVNVMDGSKIEDSCNKEPLNQIDITSLKRGLYKLLIFNSNDFSITSNGIDIKDKLLFIAQNDSYNFLLKEFKMNLVISEINTKANINLQNMDNTLFYENKVEPFNTLEIEKLSEGEYSINDYILFIDIEPYLIKFKSVDENLKISNPSVFGESEELKLYYQGSTKRYSLTLTESMTNFSINVENGSATLRELTTGKEIHSFDEEPFNEISLTLLPKGEYEVLISGSDKFTIGNLREDLREKLILNEQIDNYKLVLEKNYKSISIKEVNSSANIVISAEKVFYESKNNSLEIFDVKEGIYDVNINLLFKKEEIDEPIIDKSQKFSNPILTSSSGEINLIYTNFVREYILTLNETHTNLIITKESDCGIFVNRVGDEGFKDICESGSINSFKVDKIEAGEYNIHIVGSEEFEIYSDSGNLKDKLKLVGKRDSYKFKIESVVANVILKDSNESLEVSINSDFINYYNEEEPYNILNLTGLKAGEYEVDIHANLEKKEETQIEEIDEKYKFSNPKVLAGLDELKLNYVNFERHYQFSPKEDYENITITKDGSGCGVIMKNLSNGGEIIDSCKNEIQNILNINLLKKGDYIISIIGSENFTITSNGENLKGVLKFKGKSDNYTLILDSIKRDIIIRDKNETSMIEIFDTKDMGFKYVKSEYPFNFMSIPYLRVGTYGVNINAFIVSDTMISKPIDAEVVEDENKTEIITKPIELISGFNSKIQTVIDDKGKVEAIVGIRDRDDNLIKETIFKAPKGGEVEIDESGNLKHILTTTKAKAEIIAKSSGEIEAKIDINDEEKLKREFIVPAGSETEVKDDGTTMAVNEIEGEKGNYETNIEVKSDGEVSATAFLYSDDNKRATKLSTGLLTASYTARREFSSVKVEFIWDEVNSSRKLRATKIESGLLKATYTTRRTFSFEGENLNYRDIDISNSENIIITPSPEATFEENQYFLGENEGYRTIELIEGEANITIDGQTSMMSSEIYILPKVDGKELYLAEGWNLISIPINVDISSDITSEDANYTLDSFGNYMEFWKFNNNSWEKNPDIIKSGEGFWIYLNAENYSLFMGSGYDINFSNLNDGWHLFGAGKDLENLKDEYNFKQIYKFSRENNASTWIKDPNLIYRGEGFWIESEYEPYLKEEALQLSKGWNLISIPIDEDIELFKFEYEKIWSYENSVWQVPTKLSSKKAYWVKVENDMEVNFNGYSYKPNLNNLLDGWNLVGTGENLIDIKEYYGFETIFKYDNEWIENPTVIYSGEGFWIYN